MYSVSFNADFAVLAGFGYGLYSFVKGFRIFREYRVLEDTPETPIRSMAMGLVEIHGKAKGEQFVPSPVSKTSCLFYKVDIERWVKDKRGGHWSHANTHADGVKFYLEDGTGKVLVDAHNAEYDLLQTAKRETGGGLANSLSASLFSRNQPALATGPGASEDELFAYAHSVVKGGGFSFSLDGGSLLSAVTQGPGNLLGGASDRYRLTEYLILPEHWYDVAGTCKENPQPADEHDRNMIAKGENEPTFLISWRGEKEIKSTLRQRAMLHIFGGGALAVVCLGILLARFGWL